MEKTFTITLGDGTQLTGLGLTGNSFIREEPITAQDFDGKLKNVVISCDNDEDFRDRYGLIGEHEYMELLICGKDIDADYKGKYLFALRELTKQEIRDLEIDARLDYHDMMLGE